MKNHWICCFFSSSSAAYHLSTPSRRYKENWEESSSALVLLQPQRTSYPSFALRFYYISHIHIIIIFENLMIAHDFMNKNSQWALWCTVRDTIITIKIYFCVQTTCCSIVNCVRLLCTMYFWLEKKNIHKNILGFCFIYFQFPIGAFINWMFLVNWHIGVLNALVGRLCTGSEHWCWLEDALNRKLPHLTVQETKNMILMK